MREKYAPGRTRTCGPLLSIQHQAFPDRPFTRVCWLDYILDIAVPARIVSEEPLICVIDLRKVSCGLPNPPDCYSIESSTEGSKGVPAYGAVHLMSSSPIRIPH